MKKDLAQAEEKVNEVLREARFAANFTKLGFHPGFDGGLQVGVGTLIQQGLGEQAGPAPARQVRPVAAGAVGRVGLAARRGRRPAATARRRLRVADGQALEHQHRQGHGEGLA